MVDVISTRIQESWGYAGWRKPSSLADERDGGNSVEQRTASLNNARHLALKRHKSVEKFSAKAIRDGNLYEIKEVPHKQGVVLAPSRPFVGLSCDRCTPRSRESLRNTPKQVNVINVLSFGRVYSENGGFLVRGFCDIIQACRVRMYSFKQVADAVIKDERLIQAVEQVTQDTLNKIETGKLSIEDAKSSSYSSIQKSTMKRAKAILINMRSKISDTLLRFVSWSLYKLLPYFISSISLSPTQLDVLKKANESGLPLIFVPLHRSHLDYILVTYILLNNNIKCPLVAAGDNLKIPFFGCLLRGLGAFYIKRRLESNGSSEKDILYRATLHTYMIHCLRAHHNIEFFIEGGRSRTGKPLLPKSGILSVIVDAYLDGTIEDALLVPVSMNYEKLVDGNFIREQTGAPKQMESFKLAMGAIWKILNSHYGAIRIDFNQPFSMKELVRTFQQQSSKLSPSPITRSPSQDPFNNSLNGTISIKKLSVERCLTSRQSCSSLYGTDEVIEEQQGLVECIARHVVYDSALATAVMSTNAVAYLLLTKFRQGCSLEVLAKAVSSLTEQLAVMRRDVGFSGNSIDVVNHAVDLLGTDMILRDNRDEKMTIKPVLATPNIIELSYYSNSVLSHFAMQSILATAIQTFVDNTKETEFLCIPYNKLVDASLQLCEIMSQEFILFKPCQNLEDTVTETIEEMLQMNVLGQVRQNLSTNDDQAWCRRFAHTLDEDADEYLSKEIEYYVSFEENALRIRHQLQTALRPLMETYSITASCLPKILDSEDGILESDFVKLVLRKTTLLLTSGECQYGEALSSDAIKNCLRLIRQWGILEVHAEGRLRKLHVTRQHKNSRNINEIIRLINQFKTEMPRLPGNTF